jgi:hypothetical protein
MDHPVVRAVRDRAVCMVNPFRCKILHKKASLAVLSDERNAHLFTAGASARRSRAHPLDARGGGAPHHEYDGEDGRPAAVDRGAPRALVLKPNDEYGGKGIVLGWEDRAGVGGRRCAPRWPSRTSCRSGSRCPASRIPSWSTGGWTSLDRMLDTAPFVFHGAYMDGCLTRLSTASLVNVTAGGGSAVATFLVDRWRRLEGGPQRRRPPSSFPTHPARRLPVPTAELP